MFHVERSSQGLFSGVPHWNAHLKAFFRCSTWNILSGHTDFRSLAGQPNGLKPLKAGAFLRSRKSRWPVKRPVRREARRSGCSVFCRRRLLGSQLRLLWPNLSLVFHVERSSQRLFSGVPRGTYSPYTQILRSPHGNRTGSSQRMPGAFPRSRKSL